MLGPEYVISPLDIKVPTTIPRPLWETTDQVIAINDLEATRRQQQSFFLEWFKLLEFRLDELAIGSEPRRFRPYIDGCFEDMCTTPQIVNDRGSKIEVVRLVCDRPEQDVVRGGWVLQAKDCFVDRTSKRISILTGDEEIWGFKTSKDYDVEWSYTEETGPSLEDHAGDISLVVGRNYERDVLHNPRLGQQTSQAIALYQYLEGVTPEDARPIGSSLQVVAYPSTT